jgi:hypothetical protein
MKKRFETVPVEAGHPINQPVDGMVRMLTSESEVLRLAREMIKQHGTRAGFRVAERLNDRIDEGDWRGGDVWAGAVQAVHEL